MTLQTYFLGLVASIVLCLVSLALIVVYIDPTKTSLLGFALFYASFFFLLTSLFSIAGFYLRRKSKKEAEFVKAEKAFRQGALLSLIFIGILILQSIRILSFSSAIFIILAASVLELYFENKNKS